MLLIPENINRLKEFSVELVDECMATSNERAMMYTKGAQYYYTGSGDVKAAIHNKKRTFIDRL